MSHLGQSRRGGDAPDASSLLNAFDFSAIEEMDPSLGDGYRVLYDREVPFELRTSEFSDGPNDTGSLEAVKAKILLLGDEMNPTSIRVELTSENDLFFNYVHNMDDEGFRLMQRSQRLMVTFTEYHNVLIRMFNQGIKEPHSHLCVLFMNRDGSARLDFIQNVEYRFLELMSLNLVAASEDSVRKNITYRYNSIKSRLALMQARLQDVNALVKIKNPSLLLQLQRTPPRLPAKANGGHR